MWEAVFLLHHQQIPISHSMLYWIHQKHSGSLTTKACTHLGLNRMETTLAANVT